MSLEKVADEDRVEPMSREGEGGVTRRKTVSQFVVGTG